MNIINNIDMLPQKKVFVFALPEGEDPDDVDEGLFDLLLVDDLEIGESFACPLSQVIITRVPDWLASNKKYLI